ncbi:MAG: LPS translocon maturation chaperone LptM [Oceanicaulis sp.]
MIRIAIAVLAAAAALVLSGCGIRGDLERPPPLWGPDERPEAVDPETQPSNEDDGDEVDEAREMRGAAGPG